MTAEEMIAHLRGPARQAVNDLIGHYFGTSDKVLASIPADPEQDADLIAATAVVEAADHIETLARRVLELEEMIAAEREKADRLERALAVSIEDGMWNAFSLGHVRNDRWHHQCMSDAEELVFALGMNLEDKSWDAAAMKAAIPEGAKEKAAAIRARGE